jgi:hypothetical protein
MEVKNMKKEAWNLRLQSINKFESRIYLTNRPPKHNLQIAWSQQSLIRELCFKGLRKNLLRLFKKENEDWFLVCLNNLYLLRLWSLNEDVEWMWCERKQKWLHLKCCLRIISKESISRPTFKPGISRIWNRKGNYSTQTFRLVRNKIICCSVTAAVRTYHKIVDL